MTMQKTRETDAVLCVADEGNANKTVAGLTVEGVRDTEWLGGQKTRQGNIIRHIAQL